MQGGMFTPAAAQQANFAAQGGQQQQQAELLQQQLLMQQMMVQQQQQQQLMAQQQQQQMMLQQQMAWCTAGAAGQPSSSAAAAAAAGLGLSAGADWFPKGSQAFGLDAAMQIAQGVWRAWRMLKLSACMMTALSAACAKPASGAALSWSFAEIVLKFKFLRCICGGCLSPS
jgi:hypothetical protein